jgi:hypothetical protein
VDVNDAPVGRVARPATCYGVLDGRVDHTGPTSSMSWVEVLPQPRLRGTGLHRLAFSVGIFSPRGERKVCWSDIATRSGMRNERARSVHVDHMWRSRRKR